MEDIYSIDIYLSEIQDTQGKLFEFIVSKSNYDFIDFVHKYFNSNLKYFIDNRHPVFSNHSYDELLDDLDKENINFKVKSEDLDPWMANWIGEFYAYMQCYFHVYTKDLLKMFPLELVMRRYNGLHDYDLGVLADKLAKN